MSWSPTWPNPRYSTKKETLDTALYEVPANRRRVLAPTLPRAAAEEGSFPLGLFEERGNYRRCTPRTS